MRIGDKNRPIAGNINGLIELKKEHGIDIINGFDKGSFGFESVRALTFVALKYGHRKEVGKELDFTIEDVGDWVTPQNMNDVLAEVLKSFVGDVEVKGDPGAGESPGVH